MNAEADAELVAEQLRHTIDLLRAEIASNKIELAHQKEIYDRRIVELEKDRDDHETRIRSLQDGVTTFKVWSGLVSWWQRVCKLAGIGQVVYWRAVGIPRQANNGLRRPP